MIHDLFAIDMHTHLNHGAPHDSLAEPREIYRADTEHLMAMNKAAKIEKCFCSTFDSVLSSENVLEENEYMERLCRENESYYQWVVIEPRNKESYAQADRMLKNKKCVGIKLHPACQGWSLAEYMEEIADFAAERYATLLIHCQGKDDQCMLKIADFSNRLNVIVPHLASLRDIELFATERKYDNMWLDTSGIGSSRNNVVETAVQKFGSERIMFGTDTYAAGFQRGRIEYALISDRDKENILRYNAEALFARSLS